MNANELLLVVEGIKRTEEAVEALKGAATALSEVRRPSPLPEEVALDAIWMELQDLATRLRALFLNEVEFPDGSVQGELFAREEKAA